MTIGFGIIGLGNRGYKYALRTISKHPECYIEAVCDIQNKNFHEFPNSKQTMNYLDILKNPKVDAVFISTPDDTHAEIVLQAMKYNKHILCEKPLEVTEKKVRDLLEKAKDYSKVIEIGYVLRYARTFNQVKMLLEKQLIGKLVMVNAIDHIPYGGYAFFHDWHRERKKSGSLLLQKATHTLDIINWYINDLPKSIVGFGGLATMGKPGAIKKFGHSVPENLHCSNCAYSKECEESIENLNKEKGINWDKQWPDSCVFHDCVDVDDHQSLLISYQNHVKVCYQLSQFSSFYKREFQLFGTKGHLVFDDVTNEIKIYNRMHPTMVQTYKNNYKEEQMEPGDLEQLEDFLLAIKTGISPRSNLYSGGISALLALAAQKSIDNHQIVELSIE